MRYSDNTLKIKSGSCTRETLHRRDSLYRGRSLYRRASLCDCHKKEKTVFDVMKAMESSEEALACFLDTKAALTHFINTEAKKTLRRC